MENYEPGKMTMVPFTGIRRVKERADKLEAEGRSVIHFEIGQPDFDTPEHIREAAKLALDKGKTRYTSNFGIQPLREAIARKLLRDNGLRYDPGSEIMVTVGGQEGMAAALLALLDAGDEVLLSDPGYTPYSSVVRIANAVPVLVPLKESDNFNFDVEALERAITPRTKMLVLTTPGNPTGTMMERERLLRIAALCKKHDLLVISDEAYEQIVYDGNQHISFASLPEMRDRTITVQSFSKTYSMCGWRVGYIAGSADLLRIIVRCHMNVVMSAASFAQEGALAALNGPSEPLENMLAQFDARRILVYEGLKDLRIPCQKPQAAFYLFPNVTSLGVTGREFADRLLDEYGVATVPGEEFGQNGRNFVRISYATSLENCREGLERIGCFIEKLRGKA